MADSVALLASFFPPVLTPSYLLALMPLVLETISLTLGAMFIAFCVRLPLRIAAGLRLPGTRQFLAVLTALRPTPVLTLALLSVIVFGCGPGAGLVPLALSYTAAVARIFAE